MSVDLERMLLVRHQLRHLNYFDIARSSLGDTFQAAKGIAANVANTMTGRQRIGTEQIIEQFIESLIAGSSPPVTGEDGRNTVGVVEMISKRYREKYPR
jgi:hypothetical protein